MKQEPYLTYPAFMRRFFPDRVQKISVNPGFSCPNRDGKISTGGCTFCNNRSFSPAYCLEEGSITEQIKNGLQFFAHKPDYKHFIVYFQSYSNTYAPIDVLERSYREALSVPGVVGLAIGTRPDCVPNEVLDLLADLSKKHFILLELGVESTHNRTLQAINRGHDFETSADAIVRAHEKGILTAAHLIIGLPGESREDILKSADEMAHLPIDMIKLHQLQIIKNTALAKQYTQNPESIPLFTCESYIDLCIDVMERLRPDICIERFVSQSPEEWRLAPNWQLKNYEFVHRLQARIKERNAFQGRLFQI
jgi:radical SAM protein (TIGR01212 family)